MGERKAISTSLHSELTEYNSLIRSLRAKSQLDVTSHLSRASSSSGSLEKDQDDLFEQGSVLKSTNRSYPSSRHTDPPQTTRRSSPASEKHILAGRKRKRSSHSPVQYHKDNIWTRWPLLIEDVHVPEWSFQDEISVLANTAMKARSQQSAPPTESLDEAEDDAFEDGDLELSSSYLPHLTNAASNYLSTILALLMAHTPNHAQSMQNRIEPMDWSTVLNVLSSCRDPAVANMTIIDSVQSRMEVLLRRIDDDITSDTFTSGNTDNSDSRRDRHILASRMQSISESRGVLKDKLSDLIATLFTSSSPPAEVKQPSRSVS